MNLDAYLLDLHRTVSDRGVKSSESYRGLEVEKDKIIKGPKI